MPATRMACPSCDLLFNLDTLQEGQSASCTRCHAFLTTRNANAFANVASFATTALVMLAVACTFPFLEFNRAGFENATTLPQTIVQLWVNNMPGLAALTAAFILVIPAMVMLLLLVLNLALMQNNYRTWVKPLANWVFHLISWSMAEVFFVGVLVSLVKIAKMAEVTIGISFWAYAAFCILFVMAISQLDRFQSWQKIEHLT